jgi:hypothetical protein
MISSLHDLGSSSVVRPGTCLIHGSFVGQSCPTCSTFALIPGINVSRPLRLTPWGTWEWRPW